MAIKKIIAGNWKMNPTNPGEARAIITGIKKTATSLKKVQTIICPPFVFLFVLGQIAGKISLGGQDVFWEEGGAYTGDVSPVMLRNVGASYVIVGHSERRAMGETNEIVNVKMKAAIRNGLSVILCIGEKERDVHGHYLSVLEKQLLDSLNKFPVKLANRLIIAYEPVWAIGKNATGVETPEGFLHNAIFIRKILSRLIGKNKALAVPVLYGGSVSINNAESFLREGRADGLLVGRESLNAKNFSAILRLAEQVK